MSERTRSDVARTLRAALVPASSGGRVVTVSGPAGIGKTTVLRACTEDVGTGGVRVVASTAHDAEAHQPFAAIWPLLQASGSDERVWPLVLPADPVTAALSRMDEWCADGPVLLWVDDAHHLDAGTITVLTRLGRATTDLPLTLLLSARWWSSRPDLTVLADLASLSVEIPPLTPGETGALVRERTGRLPGPRLTHQFGVAAGNPFALSILLDLLEQAGATHPEGGTLEVELGDRVVPEAATVAARAQLHTLPAETRDLATTVAVLSPPADPEDVAAVLDRPLAGLLYALRPAEQAGILHWGDGRLVFGHDAYQDALLADLPVPLRQAIHRKAVRVLQHRGAPAEQVAEHVLRGGDGRAAGLVRTVAAQLTATAPGIAADLLAELQPLIAPTDTDDVVLQRAEVLFLSGRPQECEELIRTYLPRVTSTETAMRLQQLSLSALQVRGRVGAVLGQVENLLHQPGLTSAGKRSLLLQREHTLLNGGRLQAAEVECRRIRAQYGGFVDDTLILDEAAIALLHGRAAEAEHVVAELAARSTGPPGFLSRTRMWQAMTASYAHPPLEGRARTAEARSVSASYAARWMLPYHDAVLGVLCADAGWWDDAVAVLDAGLELAEETGSGWMASPAAVRARIDLHRGDPAAARRRLDALARRGLPPFLGLDVAGQVHVLLLEQDAVQRCFDDPRENWSTAHRAVRRRAEELWQRARALRSEMWQARIAVDVLRTAGPDVRQDLAAAMTAWVTGQMPAWDPVRDLVLAVHSGDLAQAASAAAALTTVGNALTAAEAWEEVGLLAAGRRDATQSRTALRTALVGYTALGATTDIRRVRARAHRAGIRLAATSAGSRPSFGWQSLTPTEQTVAQLVQQGMTNPQVASSLFLSPRTVQSHVSSILRKTGLHSRVEIATAGALAAQRVVSH